MYEIKLETANKLAQACRILAKTGHRDLDKGHVSAREPGSQEIYMKSSGKGLDEIEAEDIILIDMEGNKLSGAKRCHNEFPIHTEIYRVRPEINCVIHTHPMFATILSGTCRTIRAFNHQGILFQDLPIFEETCQLIVTKQQGQAVARTLGNAKAMLLRNHGVVVAGTTVEETVILAVSLEKAAQIEIIAAGFANAVLTIEEEIPILIEQAYNPQQIDSKWQYLVRACASEKGCNAN